MIRKGPGELTQSGEKENRLRKKKKEEKAPAESDKRDGTRGYKRGRRDRVGARRNRRERERAGGGEGQIESKGGRKK